MDKEDAVRTYDGIASGMTKGKIMPFAATWTDLELITPGEIERQIPYDSTYMWDLKKVIQVNVQGRNKFTDTENKRTVTKVKRVGTDKLGGWD